MERLFAFWGYYGPPRLDTTLSTGGCHARHPRSPRHAQAEMEDAMSGFTDWELHRKIATGSTQHIPLDATTRLYKRPETPRTFTLKFNQSKLKSANPVTRQRYQEWKEVEGVLFTNGIVCLERPELNKNAYDTLTDMCDDFAAKGKYTIIWHDEQEEASE